MNKIPETQGEFQNPTKLSPFIIWTKQNFPFIEDTFEQMDYYGLLSKVVEHLNNVISNLNINEENISYLNQNFINLQSFVDNYFTNLDVQSEINNKLDEMASSGALDDIFQPYLSDFENVINSQITLQNQKIAALSSTEPKFVNNTNEMTDTSQVYILSNNGHIYYYSGTAFVDSGLTYGITENSMTGYITILNSADAWSVFENNLNNMVSNRIYLVLTNPESDVLNLPPSPTKVGSLIVYNNDNSKTLSKTQIFITNKNLVYTRICWSSNKWSEWKQLIQNDSNKIFNFISITNDSIAQKYDYDLNNMNSLGIYSIQFSSSNWQNAPFLPTLGSLIYFTPNSNMNIGQMQIFISNNNVIYHRIKWSGGKWSNWSKEVTLDDISNENSNYLDLYKSFLKVGVIGDSLASGECIARNNGDLVYVDNYDVSWGQYMARSSGNKYINFSKGGLNTKTWLTSDVGLSKVLNTDNQCDLYYIGLGVNDYLNNNVPIGSIDDIDINNCDTNPDTFYGNYAKIISKIKESYPTVKFFCMTMPRSTEAAQPYNQAIRDIVNLFDNTYLLDLYEFRNLYEKPGFIKSQERAQHYNSIAYNYMAQIIALETSKYMYNNKNEFKYLEFINTDYKY